MYMTTAFSREPEVGAGSMAIDISVDSILEFLFGHDTSERQCRLARTVLARNAGITLVSRSGHELVEAMTIHEFLLARRGMPGWHGEWKECFRLEEPDGHGGSHVHANVMISGAPDGEPRTFDVFATVRSATTIRGSIDDVTVVYDEGTCDRSAAVPLRAFPGASKNIVIPA